MIKIKGYINPTVIKTDSGNYAVSGSNWKSVPEGTELEDIEWVDTRPNIKKSKPMSWKVKDYTVTLDKNLYSCNCLGYTYRRSCKHITQVSESFRTKLHGRAGSRVV